MISSTVASRTCPMQITVEVLFLGSQRASVKVNPPAKAGAADTSSAAVRREEMRNIGSPFFRALPGALCYLCLKNCSGRWSAMRVGTTILDVPP